MNEIAPFALVPESGLVFDWIVAHSHHKISRIKDFIGWLRAERMSGWSQSDPPSGAIEKRHAEFILEGFDLLSHG
jgi:hypothetical protein